MNNFVKDLANKDYRYLPYLWSIEPKIKGTWVSLEYYLKNAKVLKILILTLLGLVEFGVASDGTNSTAS